MARSAAHALLLSAGCAHAEPATIAINAGVAALYNSNVYRLSPLEIALEDFPSVADNMLSPHGEINAHLPVGLQEIALHAYLGYVFYHYNTALDSVDTNLSVRFNYDVPGRCTGYIGGSQTRSQIDFTDLQPKRPSLVVTNSAAAKADCTLATNIALLATADYASQANLYQPFAVYDLNQTNIYARLGYGQVETAQVYGAARYRNNVQPNAILISDGTIGVSSTIWDVGGGVAWQPARVKLDAALYWSQLRETTGIRDASTLGVNVTLDWDLTAKTRIKAYATRGFVATPYVGAIAYKAESIGGQLIWQATPKLVATADIGWLDRQIYKQFYDGAGAAAARQQDDSTFLVSTALDYLITDRLRLRGAVGYGHRSSNYEDARFTFSSASIGLGYQFVGPPIDTGLY
jgi:hypothetical protein